MNSKSLEKFVLLLEKQFYNIDIPTRICIKEKFDRSMFLTNERVSSSKIFLALSDIEQNIIFRAFLLEDKKTNLLGEIKKIDK